MAGSPSWLKWVGIGCGGVIVLIAALVTVLFFTVKSMTAGPEQVAKDFLAAASAGDYARAHDAFSAPLKESQPLEAFTAAVKARPSLFSVADLSFTDRSIDLAGAKLAGTATLKSGTQVPVSFTFAKEHDTWKLLSYHIGSQD
ncbi:MAG: hypothetical protein NTY02_01130 [Acidobacteria bacterium]|nr:hypothetical protein [Acidobacteriota bacterium]